MGFYALSHDGCEDLVCDVDQTDFSLVFAVTLVSFLVDRADDAVIPFLRHLFTIPNTQQNLVEFFVEA